MIVAMAGGVGGARLVRGLAAVLAPEQLMVVVNVGDDFDHMNLRICPDLDTVMYTLAGLENTELGWGRADETWSFMETLGTVGGETWFLLGDRDLAVHVLRTQQLAAGQTLSEVTAALHQRLGIAHRIVPASDDAVRTTVLTADGELEFQRYFVRERCAPVARGFRYDGVQQARLSPALAAAIDGGQIEGVIFCPSNPYLSIEPLLAMPALAQLVDRVPTVAVSPIIGGAAVKGPAAKLMRELGRRTDVVGMAEHYGARVDGWVIDNTDAALAAEVAAGGARVHTTATLMKSPADSVALARETLVLLRSLM